MKNLRLFSLLFFPAMLVSCGSTDKPVSKNWDIFCKALSLTSSLKTYNIDIVNEENGILSTEKKILSEKEDKTYIAYRKIGINEKYWVEGYSYILEDNEKIKYGESLSKFLDINNEPFSFSYEDVKDTFIFKNGIYSFTLAKEGYSKVCFECTKNDYFILTLDCSFYVGNEVSKKTKYSYINPGQNPVIVLPTNLNEYHF